jgi:hypothetical protein
MKQVTRYIAEDGKEFSDASKCSQYETDMQLVLIRTGEQKDAGEALVVLMTEAMDMIHIANDMYVGYTGLFRAHQPCAKACSLWRIFSDYSHMYPTLYKIYDDLIEKYVALYGEPKTK